MIKTSVISCHEDATAHRNVWINKYFVWNVKELYDIVGVTVWCSMLSVNGICLMSTRNMQVSSRGCRNDAGYKLHWLRQQPLFSELHYNCKNWCLQPRYKFVFLINFSVSNKHFMLWLNWTTIPILSKHFCFSQNKTKRGHFCTAPPFH